MNPSDLTSLAQLDRLTLAIGKPHFGADLMRSFAAISDADHCLIFVIHPREGIRLAIDVGKEGGSCLAELVPEVSQLIEPHIDAVRMQHCDQPVRWFSNAWFKAKPRLRERLRSAFDVSDMVSFTCADRDCSYYVVLMRKGPVGLYENQKWLLTQVGELISANIRKHFSYLEVIFQKKNRLVESILRDSSKFSGITRRERAICVGILTGHTSEGIALNLGITINSVLTYRRRLYSKLGIHSQNELFGYTLRAAEGIRINTPPAGVDLPVVVRPGVRAANGTPLGRQSVESHLIKAIKEKVGQYDPDLPMAASS